ncbi:RNA-directed DNA polymerase, eukaryota [Tanacetum coccineum]
MSGTTAITVLVIGDKLYIVNVGDSRAVISVKEGDHGHVVAQDLSRDQTPFRTDECERDMSCPICDNAIESTDHLFFRCRLVRDIANKVLSWWNLDHANLNSYAEWKSWLVSIRMDSKLKKMFEGVWLHVNLLTISMRLHVNLLTISMRLHINTLIIAMRYD